MTDIISSAAVTAVKAMVERVIEDSTLAEAIIYRIFTATSFNTQTQVETQSYTSLCLRGLKTPLSAKEMEGGYSTMEFRDVFFYIPYGDLTAAPGIHDELIADFTALGTPTYASTTTFTLTGDQTTALYAGRPLMVTVTSVNYYNAVSTSSYSAGTGLTTVTVTTANLTSGLTAGWYGERYEVLPVEGKAAATVDTAKSHYKVGARLV